MKLGIIGLPGAGKSTVFEALTQIQSEENGIGKPENRIGTIRVPDERVDFLSNMFQPKKTIHTQVEYLLPERKPHGQDLKKEGNIWSVVRNCDALIHVVRNFREYGQEEPAPEKDFFALDQEMIFTDLMIVEKRLERLEMDKKRGRKIDPEELVLLTECQKMLEAETPLRHSHDLAAAHLLKGYAFVSAKPMLVLFNNEDEDEKIPVGDDFLKKEKCMVARGRLEHELYQIPAEDAEAFLQEFNVTSSAMDRVIEESYKLLGLVSFFTVGEDEVRAWTITGNTQAVDAAEVIHSDIKKGFIRAEVLAYQDLVAAGSYKEARKRGTVRLEGKTYIVKDGDIIEFRFNV